MMNFQELKKFSIQRLSDLVENNTDMQLLKDVLSCDI